MFHLDTRILSSLPESYTFVPLSLRDPISTHEGISEKPALEILPSMGRISLYSGV